MIFDHHNFLSQKCYACGCDQVAEKRIYELLETEYISFCSRFFGIEFISSGRLCPSCYIYLHQLATVGSKVPNLTIINCPDTHMPTHMPVVGDMREKPCVRKMSHRNKTKDLKMGENGMKKRKGGENPKKG